MFLNRSQILSIFIAQLCFPLTYAKPKKVEGCPNLGDLESQNEVSAAQLNSLILCFCEVISFYRFKKTYEIKELENSEAEVSCLYGSNITHLEKASDAIKKANLKLTKVGKRLQSIDSEWRYHIIFLLHLYRYFCANESSPITI